MEKTPLHLAAEKGDHTAVVILRNGGASLDIPIVCIIFTCNS